MSILYLYERVYTFYQIAQVLKNHRTMLSLLRLSLLINICRKNYHSYYKNHHQAKARKNNKAWKAFHQYLHSCCLRIYLGSPANLLLLSL
nr:MAG TPA: hypothetical protein [Caudoviricetes sp.]